MRKPATYLVWYRRFLKEFYLKNRNSTAPSNHLMSVMYDQYYAAFYKKQGVIINEDPTPRRFDEVRFAHGRRVQGGVEKV